MRKLTLSLDDLHVETFQTLARPPRLWGTVRAAQQDTGESCQESCAVQGCDSQGVCSAGAVCETQNQGEGCGRPLESADQTRGEQCDTQGQCSDGSVCC